MAAEGTILAGLSVPSPARIRDVLLGGRDNFARDREMAQALIACYPTPPEGRLPAPREMAVSGRLFLARAAGWAVSRGAAQVIDVRCGLPVPPVAVLGDGTRVPLLNTHEAARDADPAARCAYVDDDPHVISHVRALSCPDAGVTAVEADPFDPAAVLGHPDLAGVIDLAEPACLLLGMMLHYADEDRARAAASGYAAALAPGSYVAVSVTRVAPGPWEKVSAAYRAAPAWNHPPETVRGFFAGLELVPPGLCDARTWRPGWGQACAVPDEASFVLAGVGRKA